MRVFEKTGFPEARRRFKRPRPRYQ